MRRSEILGLRWLDVDIANHRVLLPQTKNGDGRIVYLNESAVAVLRSRPFHAQTKATERLFPKVIAIPQMGSSLREMGQELGQDFVGGHIVSVPELRAHLGHHRRPGIV